MNLLKQLKHRNQHAAAPTVPGTRNHGGTQLVLPNLPLKCHTSRYRLSTHRWGWQQPSPPCTNAMESFCNT